MSRIAKNPVPVPSGVKVRIENGNVSAQGPKGELSFDIHELVEVREEDGTIRVGVRQERPDAWALAGTSRAIVANMIQGVSQGFERTLNIVGVGYRAQMQGRGVQLALGFSHPVIYEPPEGVTLETPAQTTIVVRGPDKQKVGQVAAVIRRYRPPEPYKGKGIRYADEVVVRKQAKKK